MADRKRLAYSIIQFLHDQLQNGGLSADALESLEGWWLVVRKVVLPLLAQRRGRFGHLLSSASDLGCSYRQTSLQV